VSAPDGLWPAIAALDRYRRRFAGTPDTLSNAILAGTLLQPLGLIGRRQRFAADPLERRVELGLLPIPRRDVERLQQILGLQHRLLDMTLPVRAQRGLMHRAVFPEALTWLDIHGERPEVVAHWRDLQAQAPPPQAAAEAPPLGPFQRRRRRRRRPRAPYVAPQE
jgi:hypothetical protein